MIDIIYVTGGIFLLCCSLYVWHKTREVATLVVRQVAYDALAYAWEKMWTQISTTKENFTPEEQLDIAVSYMRTVFPLMTKTRAHKYCSSLAAKMTGIGYSSAHKV